MESKISGSCYCGKIQFSLNGKPKIVVNCHCDDCKKRNGTVFSTYIAVAENDLQLSTGQDSLKRYEAANVGIKYFCPECGSPIYNQNFRLPGLNLLFYGALSHPTEYTPDFNVFCSTKAAWVDDIKSIQSFQESIER